MKAKTNKIRMMIALFAVLTVTMIVSIGATAAVAGPHIDRSPALDILGASDYDKLSEILDSSTPATFHLVPGVIEAAFGDEPAITDGGDWEPVFPEEDTAPIPDGGDWEPVFPDDCEDADEPADEAGDDEAVEPADEAVDEPADEPAEEPVDEPADEPAEEPVDEVADEPADEPAADEGDEDMTAQEEPQEDDDALQLPFTGGNSTPWLIAGAAIVLAGIIVLVGRRSRKETR